MNDHDTLKLASDKALWLESHYDELPSRADPHIYDVIQIAKQLITEIGAIKEDAEEWGRQAFGSNRIRARS